MKFIFFMLFGFGAAAADIYHWVDDNGREVYSDQPVENAEQIELHQSMTYTPVQILEDVASSTDENQQNKDEADPAASYQLSIVSPEDDAGIRINNGNVMVNLQVLPVLVAERGDLIQLYLDGFPAGMPMPQLSFMLENLDRGTHKLSAAVVNAAGEVLTQSETTTFHLQRSSLLQPSRQQNNQPTPGAPTTPSLSTTPGLPAPPRAPGPN